MDKNGDDGPLIPQNDANKVLQMVDDQAIRQGSRVCSVHASLTLFHDFLSYVALH